MEDLTPEGAKSGAERREQRLAQGQRVSLDGKRLPPYDLRPWENSELPAQERFDLLRALLGVQKFTLDRVVLLEALAGRPEIAAKMQETSHARWITAQCEWLSQCRSPEEFAAAYEHHYSTPTAWRLSPLECAHEVLKEFTVDAKGVVRLTVPAGILDIEALYGLDIYLRTHFPELRRGVLQPSPGVFREAEKVEGYRNPFLPRLVRVMPVVAETVGVEIERHRSLLEQALMRPTTLIEQALVAAAYSCATGGKDPFNGHAVTGGLSGIFGCVSPEVGFSLVRFHSCPKSHPQIAAAGAVLI